MTDLVLAALMILIVVALVGVAFIYRYYVTTAKSRKHPNAQWQLEEHPRATTKSGPGAWAVYCVHPDEENQLVDAVYWNDPDFEGKIEEVRSQGRMRLAALNSKELKR